MQKKNNNKPKEVMLLDVFLPNPGARTPIKVEEITNLGLTYVKKFLF